MKHSHKVLWHLLQWSCAVIAFLEVEVSVFSQEKDTGSRTGQVIEVYPDYTDCAVPADFFGVCPMFWVENDARMEDGKIESALRYMNCRFLRFPGGTESDNFIWYENNLHNQKRWPGPFSYSGQELMDTDEFIALCRRLDATPVICVNTEIAVFENVDKAVEMAAAWVRYCNVEKGYNVKYWEIGNEPYFHFRFNGYEYAELLKKMSSAMKVEDPDIEIVAVGPHQTYYLGAKEMVEPELQDRAEMMELSVEQREGRYTEARLMSMKKYNRKGTSWWEAVLQTAGDHIDAISVHWYYNLKELAGIETYIRALHDMLRKYTGEDKEVMVTEWSLYKTVPKTGMDLALTAVEGAARFIRGGVSKAAYWPLRVRGKTLARRSLLDYETKESTPNIAALSMMSRNIGDRLVKTAGDTDSLFHFASVSGKSKKVTVFILNKSREQKTLSVTVKDWKKCNVEVDCMYSGDNVHAVKKTSCKMRYDGRRLPVTLPPVSMSVIEFN